MAHVTEFNTGDTLILKGDRCNGRGHEWALTISWVERDDWDAEYESAPDMVFTNGYCFSDDTLYSKESGGRRLGHFFYGFIKQ